MNEVMVVIWIVVMLLFALIEALSPQLIGIWFSVAAIFSVIAAVFRAPLLVQIAIFVFATAVLLLVTRPLARKFVKKPIKTNSEALIGCEAVVLSDIDNVEGVGTVNVGGQVWSARSVSGGKLAKGETVEIDAIEGVKLMVKIKGGEK